MRGAFVEGEDDRERLPPCHILVMAEVINPVGMAMRAIPRNMMHPVKSLPMGVTGT